jgi:hypothetical protein
MHKEFYQMLFDQMQYQKIIDLTKSSYTPIERWYRIRSLIEENLLEDAERELGTASQKSKISIPLICLILKKFQTLSLNSNGKLFWFKYKNLILNEILECKKKENWIERLIADSLWEYESELDERFHELAWLASKAQNLLQLEDPNELLDLISAIEVKFGKDYNLLLRIKGQIEQKKSMHFEALDNYQKYFRGSDKGLDKKLFLLRFLNNTFGINTSLLGQDIVDSLTEKPSFEVAQDFKTISNYIELREALFAKNAYTTFKVNQVVTSETEQWGAPSPKESVLRGFQILSSETKNEPLPQKFEDFHIYAVEPTGKAFYLSRPKTKKLLLREAPFCRLAAYKQNSGELCRIDIGALSSIKFTPSRHRFIASPGRVGSTLIHKILREALIECISETWVDYHVPNLTWNGRISSDDSITLSQLDSYLLFDEDERPKLVVKKLAGDSCRHLQSLMGENDDVVFLYRELEPWLKSYQKLGATPKRVSNLLVNTLHSHIAMIKRNKVVNVLTYDDLVELNEGALDKAFGDLGGQDWKKYELDAQDETPFSRLNLKNKQPKYSMGEYLEEINKTGAIDIARDLDLDLLRPLSSPISPSIFSKPQTERESVLVIPSNKWGEVDHYYHFMFGIFLPFISSELEHFNKSQYYFSEVGSMSRHLHALNNKGWCIKTHENVKPINSEMRNLVPIGWDHPSVYDVANLERVREYLSEIFTLNQKRIVAQKNITIVGRGVDLNKTKFYDANGSERRSVPNIYELYLQLLDQVEVQFVELDSMDLETQIRLFANSDCIIAQHGAALSNILFCNPKTTIIEIVDPAPRSPFFSALSKRLDLNHLIFHQDHIKAPVNIQKMLEILEANEFI